MAQPLQDPAAEAQADAGGPLVETAVAAGEAGLEDTRKVGRVNTDAGVPDTSTRGRSSEISMKPEGVYLMALESTCSMTNRSHFSSVNTVHPRGS